MKDSSTWVTPAVAAKLIGYTQRHVTSLINKGKLSATREDGRYYIDKAELFRVFPDAHRKEQQRNPEFIRIEQEKMVMQNEMLKDSISKLNKEVEFLRGQIDLFNQKEIKILNTMDSQMKLLEHQGQKRSPEQRRSWVDIFKKRDK